MTLCCFSEDCVRILPRDGRTIIVVRCQYGDLNVVNNGTCRGKLLLRLSLLNKGVKRISLLVQEKDSLIEYSPSTIKLLSDYSYRLSKIRRALMRFWAKYHVDNPWYLQRRCSCSCVLYKSVTNCKDYVSFFKELGIAYVDPLAFYNFLCSALLEADKVRCKDRKCANILRSLLAFFLKETEDSQLILLIKNNQGALENEVYKDVFRPKRITKLTLSDNDFKKLPIKSYDIEVFKIEICNSRSSCPLYHVSLNLPYELKCLSNVLIESIGKRALEVVMKQDSLWDKICFLKDIFEAIVKNKGLAYGDNSLAEKIALFSAYRTLGVHKLMPFLLDKHIDEVFLDRPGTRVYIDHEEFGRCVSNIILRERDVERFINHVLIESKLPLNRLNPSLKWNLRMGNFIVRTSIDIPPLSHEGPSLDLRKIKHRVYTMVDLFFNNVLSREEAAFLVLHVMNRRNIIICGEPGTGKTTLMNALDLCTPKNWRKVYVEDVVESLDQRSQGRYQLRLYVEPFEVERKTRKKSVEIIKLLHRTPDWICLGELQSKEHFKALFHAIAAGLRGIHTCHASSVFGLIRRLVLHYGIPKEDLSGIDLIIYMVKCYQGSRVLRRVAEVWAVGMARSASIDLLDIPLSLVFKWDPERDAHYNVLNDIFRSPSILKLLESGNDYARLRREYEELKALFDSLALSPPQGIEHFAKVFDAFLQRLEKEGAYVI